MTLADIGSVAFLGNDALTWGIALGIAVGVVAVMLLLRWLIVHRLKRIATKTTTHVDDAVAEALDATRLWFLVLVGVTTGARWLSVSEEVDRTLQWLLVIGVALQAGIWGSRIIEVLTRSYVEKHRESSPGAATAGQAIAFFGRVFIWTVALLVALENLGYDITAVVAGLGVGGVAIALAVQNILGDLFASLSILLDKPFLVGDFIIVGDMLGTVEKVGLKTTRVRSLSGEQLIFSNSDLLASRVRNYKRMEERRVAFTFGVVYQTTPEQLEAIPPMVREIVERTERARFDRAHFKAFGDFALIFEVVYYIDDPDYNLYMDVQQTLNLAIMRGLAERGVEFAYPTQTLYLKRDAGPEEPTGAQGTGH
jgi:small-conductance mechanosensitive channel